MFQVSAEALGNVQLGYSENIKIENDKKNVLCIKLFLTSINMKLSANE